MADQAIRLGLHQYPQVGMGEDDIAPGQRGQDFRRPDRIQ